MIEANLPFIGALHVHWLDLTLIVFYLAAMIAFGFWYSKRLSNSQDYFLAGRSLPWWIIGLSIIGSNIGSNDYVGATGQAYSIGVAQANFEWIGAIPAMILAAFLFIPYYWRAGVYSVPEYLGLRYNNFVRTSSAIILSLFSVFIIGIYLSATSLMLSEYLGLTLRAGILITAIVVGVYTVSGGLAAVAISDAVQLGIMFAGGIALAVIGMHEVGGPDVFWERLSTEKPDHLNAFLPADHEQFPWPGVLLGLGIVLSPAYWCANQVILQRTMAARSQWDGQASMIFAAMAKTFIPLLIVLPGLVAALLYADTLPHQDRALPSLIRDLLPPGLSGLLFVAFIAALQSSVDSTLNATSVMISRDVWRVLEKSSGDDQIELQRGQWITVAVLLCGVLFALSLVDRETAGIYAFVQEGLSYFQGPLFALILTGMLTKRMTGAAGASALVSGVIIAIALHNYHHFTGTDGLGMLFVAFYSFVFSLVVLFVVGSFTNQKSDEDLANLTVSTTK